MMFMLIILILTLMIGGTLYKIVSYDKIYVKEFINRIGILSKLNLILIFSSISLTFVNYYIDNNTILILKYILIFLDILLVLSFYYIILSIKDLMKDNDE